jgi:uncharacterized repeat protein (TIGR01451 family)
MKDRRGSSTSNNQCSITFDPFRFSHKLLAGLPRRRNMTRTQHRHGKLPLLFFVTVLAAGAALALTGTPRFLQRVLSKDTPRKSKPAGRAKLQQIAANLPLVFELNTGQLQPQVKFVGRASGSMLRLQPDRAVLSMRNARFTQRLLGARDNIAIRGADQAVERRNYLLGNDPARWQVNVPTFRKVVYEEVYRGISLTYYGNQQQIEYDFEVAPGADPSVIRLGFDREVRPLISRDGDLILQHANAQIVEQRPSVYQLIDGQRRSIEGSYAVTREGVVSFKIGVYDKSKPLVIDPTLVYSTYLGGGSDDSGSSIAVDSSGNVYVAGTTSSTNFPTHTPAFANSKGLSDIFVTKIDAAGANILYSTYIGGSGLDRADGLAIDAAGNAYVVGRVGDTSTDFPTTTGALATTYRGGDFDGVLFELNSQGNALVYSTFLGGEDNDSAEGIAVDQNGNAYVTGGTRSNGFPLTSSGFQTFRAGDTDAYVTKLNSSGSALLYSTMLGGGGTDRGSGVVVDSAGNAYVAGYSASPDFPTQNAFQVFSGGSFDAFIAKVDTNATGAASLVFSTYLGGTADDKAYGIALDNTATNIYIAGQTSSNNLPLLNPAQPAFGGLFDAFIAKLTTGGVKVYTTYVGGTGDDRATGVAVNTSGEAYLTGFTSSTNFPTVTPLQIANAGGFDAFLTKINAAGSGFVYSTYFGGSANENTAATVTSTNPLTLDASGNAYIMGYTASTNFLTAQALQGANAGGQDVFVAKISDATPTADYSISITPNSRTLSPGGNTTYTISATPIGGFTGSLSLSVTGLSSDSTGTFAPATIVLNDTSPKSSTLTVNTTSATPSGSYTINVSATSGNLQHNASSQLIVSGASSVDLSISKTASPNPVTAQANLTYRILVTNNGPSPATNVVTTDTLPAGIPFVSAIPTQGTCSGTTTVTCNLGSMAKAASAIVNITVTPQAIGQLTNTASVTASESDPDPNDNSTTIQTSVIAASSGPSMLDPNLSVKTVVSGLSQPTSMAFIGNNDFLVLEKNTGKVQRIVNSVLQSTVLDLAVNSASERGLLGIALHPNFAVNGFVYLFWTESSTGTDSTNLADVFQPLSNRVDRYLWNGSVLTFDRNLIKLHAYQADANQSLRGNHNGGVLRFGPDGKLYILMGDNGRRGFLQNLPCGPTATCPGPVVQDDQFGGPEPDDNHLTGVILRLNDDGSTPIDNPFFNAQTNLTGQAAANVKKMFAYGVRNGFGLAFDPLSGNLWDQENGDDAFDEMNRVTAGSNNGWVQLMGPSSRIAEFKQIETTYGSGDLQQLRWSPANIADTPADALSRLYMLPGAHYNEPEFSWKYAIPAAPLGFVQGRGLGPQFEGDMFVGAARTFLYGGFLFRFRLNPPDRLHFNFNDDVRLIDRVADNTDKFDITESEPLLIGQNFGITTDIQTGPNGNLFVVSNTNGTVYEISGKQPAIFTATLNGAQETPPTNSTGTGTAVLLLSPDEQTARVSLNFAGLSTAETAAHIHGPGAPGVLAPVLFPLPNGNLSDFVIALTATDVQNLKNGLLYINVHSNNFPNGEIRGQFGTSASATSIQFNTATYLVSEAAGRAVVTVNRLGDTSTPATVDYATNDSAGLNQCSQVNGIGSQRCDYVNTVGRLSFTAGESSKTISIPLVDDGYAEGNENFNIALSNPIGGFLGSPNVATVTITDNESVNAASNPIDGTNFFVRQQYIDFLGREPDPAGFAGWTSTINNCSGDTTQCDRIHVSQLFYQSDEFQSRGYYVFKFYPVSFPGIAGVDPAGAGHKPDYAQFAPDLATVSGFLTVPQLEAAKDQFAANFAARPAFVARYGSLNNTQFVDTLLATAGVTFTATARQALIDGLNGGTLTRAKALRQIVDSPEVSSKYFNEAYVVMEYFGYLRRDPDALYLNWLDVINQSNDPRGMVIGFVNSIEYRQRFGLP